MAAVINAGIVEYGDDFCADLIRESGFVGMDEAGVLGLLAAKGVRPSRTSGNVRLWLAVAFASSSPGLALAAENSCRDSNGDCALVFVITLVALLVMSGLRRVVRL